jgi:chemotaxis protein MotB
VTRQTWIIAGFIASALAILLLFQRSRLAVEASLRAREEAASAAKTSEELVRSNAVLTAQLADLRASAEELREQVEESTRARTDVEQQMRAELESRDVTISELQGKLTVNILDRVLFDSGEARLKPDGEAVLLKVASLFGKFPARQIQVAGHTDNVPIRSRTAEGFTDNWALSAGRATAAVRFLVEKGGVDPKRIAVVGFGEFRPIADNATVEGRAKNRRIAIVLLPEEVAPVERGPAASTNSAPVDPQPAQ